MCRSGLVPKWPEGMDRASCIFDNVDADKSGEIDPDELMMHLLGLGQEPETVSALFAALDTNGDGSISREEFVTGFDKLRISDRDAALWARGKRILGAIRMQRLARSSVSVASEYKQLLSVRGSPRTTPARSTF